MKQFSSKEQLAQTLERFARDIAGRAMKSDGHVLPTLLISNDEVLIKFVPKPLTDVASKDRFAQIARLLAVANSAIAVTTILESWAYVAKEPGGPMTEKLEVVSIMTETSAGTSAIFLKIERNERGKFKKLRDSVIPAPDTVEGRFASLLPPRVPTEEDKRHARQLLQLLGLSPDGQQIPIHLN